MPRNFMFIFKTNNREFRIDFRKMRLLRILKKLLK